jgi:hypothetical protein
MINPNVKESLENHLNWIRTHLDQIDTQDHSEFTESQLISEIRNEVGQFMEEFDEMVGGL